MNDGKTRRHQKASHPDCGDAIVSGHAKGGSAVLAVQDCGIAFDLMKDGGSGGGEVGRETRGQVNEVGVCSFEDGDSGDGIGVFLEA